MPLSTVFPLITEVIKVILKKRNDTCTAIRGDGKGGGQEGERWMELWSHYKVITKKKGQVAVTTAIKY